MEKRIMIMKKQVFINVLCILIAAGALSGCEKKENVSDVSSSESIVVTNSDTSSDGMSEGFDWETVKKDITLDGMKIDFPFSVNDLGEGYEIPYVTDDLMGENSCFGTVEKQGEYTSETICTVFFDEIKSDKYNDDVKCSSIAFADSLTVQGIKIGSSIEDAEKLFGKPNKSDDVTKYYLSKSGKERIELYYDSETNKVTEVQLTLNPKEDE